MVREMPADRIIVETDCPYLAPIPLPWATQRAGLSARMCWRSWRKSAAGALEDAERAHRGRLLRPVRPDSPAPGGIVMSGTYWSSRSWAADRPAACPRADGDWGDCDPPIRRTCAPAARCWCAGKGQGRGARDDGAGRHLARPADADGPGRGQAPGRGAADPRPCRPDPRAGRHPRLLHPPAGAHPLPYGRRDRGLHDAPVRLCVRGRGRLSRHRRAP